MPAGSTQDRIDKIRGCARLAITWEVGACGVTAWCALQLSCCLAGDEGTRDKSQAGSDCDINLRAE